MKHFSRIFSRLTRNAKKKEVVPVEEEVQLTVEFSLPIHDATLFPATWLFCPSLDAVRDLMYSHGFSQHETEKALSETAPAFVIPLETENDIRCLVYITPDHEAASMSGLVGLIAHEANHVVMETFKFIGEEAPSAEISAYFQQRVTQTILGDYLDFHNLKDTLQNG